MRRREDRKLPSWVLGLILLVLIAIGSVLAYTKQLPFGNPYEVKAVFDSAQNLRPSSPVRIAGVNVGEVTGVEPLAGAESELQAQAGGELTTDGSGSGQEAAVVTMKLNEDALPLHEDATFKLRPRLFLEGNYFVDVQPGSPNAPVTEEDHTFPVSQTSYSVQLDQILTTLQGDVRRDLQVFLNQFGSALTKKGGAEGFQELYRTSGPAGKFTSQVNEAFLGTEPGDLQGVIRGLDRVLRGLGRDEEALKDFVTNFRIFSGSFAAEDEALGRAIEELPTTLAASEPAFANLNESFPALRAFSREMLPGTRSAPETLRVATPFVRQIRLLVSERELRGLVSDLRPTIPELAQLGRETIPFLEQTRRLSSCFNEVVIPWSHSTVDPPDSYPHQPVGRVFEETPYGLEGISSESRSGDANGQYIRTQAGGGANTVIVPPSAAGEGFSTSGTVGVTPFDLLGTMPRIEDSAKNRFRPDVRCETQEPPNLEAGIGPIPFQQADAPPTSPLDLLSGAEPAELRRAAKSFGLPGEAAAELAERAGEG